MTEVEEGKHCKNTHILGVDADDLMVQNLSKNGNFSFRPLGKPIPLADSNWSVPLMNSPQSIQNWFVPNNP